MNTALLVIDFINDIVSANGKTPSCAAHVQARQAIQKANTAMQFARDNQWLVLPVTVGFSENYCEQPKKSPIFGKAKQSQALSLGQWGTEFHSDLAVNPADCVITKHRVSPFYGTSLDLILRNNAIEQVVVCGVSTVWAIQAAVREGHDRDYAMVILEDACAAANEAEHQASLVQLSRIAVITTTHELASLLTV